MRLRYIKQMEGPTLCYGQTVQTGDVIDSSVWGDMEAVMVGKALRTGDWVEVKEAIQVTEAGVIVDKPKQAKRKGK